MLPIFKWEKLLPNYNGYNTPIFAKVDPNAKYPLAVAAQEIAEARRKLKWIVLIFLVSIVPALYVTIFGGSNIPYITGPILFFAGFGYMLSPMFERYLETYGHEVEVAAAAEIYDVDPMEYRLEEAETMQEYYKGFKDMSVEDIEYEMLGNWDDAESWVNNNLKYLRSLDETRPKTG